MHPKRLWQPLLGLAMLVLAVSACAPGGSGGPGVQPGDWEGTGDEGFKINFTVAPQGNAIIIYSVFYPLSCTESGGAESVVSASSVPLKGGRLELNSANVHVTAEFPSPERAEGKWTVEAHTSPEFGECRETGGTWVAMLKGANTPAPVLPAATLTLAPPPVTPEPPTLTPAPSTLTPVPPPATPLATNTLKPSLPSLAGGATFSGPLLSDLRISGLLTFTIAPDGSSLLGWSLSLPEEVTCAERGIKVSRVSAHADTPIPIQNQAFEYVSESTTFRGVFDTAATATGTFQQKFGAGASTCTIGPLAWTASVNPTRTSPPEPTVVQARTPTARPSASPTPKAEAGAAPVVKSVNLRYDNSSGSLVIFQDIAFSDPDGDADKVHFDLVRTTNANVQTADGTIDASSLQQKQGATLTGQWTCGGIKYDVTLRVTILDRAGHKSNAIEYTMNCR